MKKTITLLTLTLFLSVLAFAQKRERPMPELRKMPVKQQNLASMLAQKNPKAKLEQSKVRTVPFDRAKAVPTPAKKNKRKAPRLVPGAGECTVTLTAEDVWGDGSGYQMLLDADATAYGTIIPVSGALSNASESVYAEFEYKIPENADAALTTSNMVTDGNSVTITIPAGTYDWCITNPTPGDRMWIASASGNVGGRYDDFVFEEGKDYEFYVSPKGTGDGVDLYIDGEDPFKAEEWIFSATEVIEDAEGNVTTSDYSAPVYVRFDGDNVYIKGLSAYVPDGEIVGTRSGDQVVFEWGQYLGSIQGYNFYFVGFNNETGEYDDVTMTINADENRLTTEDWIYTTDGDYVFEQYANVVIAKPVEKAATPQTPTIDEVSVSGTFPSMRATIPTIDTEGDPMITDNLSYQLYTEIDHVQQPFVMKAGDYYYFTEDMTIIPYNFTDNYDIYPGSQHFIYLNADDIADWNKVGIKAIYKGLGETHESEIFWYTIKEYPSHTVTIVESENGTVTADKESCPEADEVTLTITPDEGYELDALTVKDADGNDVAVTGNTFEMPLTDVTVTATFKKLPNDVDITIESGNDIYAAVNEAANGAPVKNLTITLEENGEYTLSAPLEAGGNITINGAEGAVIDASGNSGAFIQNSASPMLETNSKSAYVVDNVTIKDVTVKGIQSFVYYDNKKKYVVMDFTIDNSVLELATASAIDAAVNFNAGGAINFTIQNSTVYQTGASNVNYFTKYNNSVVPDNGIEGYTACNFWTYKNNTFYKVASNQWHNGGRIAQKASTMTVDVENNIWVDCADGQILRRMFAQKSFSTFVSGSVVNANTFLKDGSPVDQGNYGNGSDLTSDPGFADAAGGDFTLAFTSEQWAQKTGDPRWLDADPTVMVAPESGDFAAIVAQAVKEGKETLALPAGASYKAGSTIKVDKKLNIIGDENDPATLELGMKGFVIKDALDMENMIIDAATNEEPFIALSDVPNEELLGANNGSSYYNIMDQLILRNLTITGVKGKLLYDNNKPYALDYVLIENCIIQLRTPKDKKETVIFMQGGGIRMLEINTSTVYQKGQGDNDFFVRYLNAARLDRMGYTRDMEDPNFIPQGFIYENNTFYKVANQGKWGNYDGFKGQKYTSFTVNKNIWVDCSNGQVPQQMLGGRAASSYEVCEFDQNTYIYNESAETEGTMKNGEPVGNYDVSGTAITKVPTFKLVATGDFTLDANDVQNKQQTGDPRWFAEEEATGIVNVNANDNVNDNQNAPAYNLAGQRVNANTAKGIIIKNGRKYVK